MAKTQFLEIELILIEKYSVKLNLFIFILLYYQKTSTAGFLVIILACQT